VKKTFASLFYMINITIRSSFLNKKIKLYVLIIAMFFLLDYVFKAILPFITANIIDNALLISESNPNVSAVFLSLFVLLLHMIFTYIFWGKMGVIETYVEDEIKNNLNARYLKYMCEVDYHHLNNPKTHNDFKFIYENIPQVCADLFSSPLLIAIIGTVLSIFITMTILINISVWVALIVLAGNVLGLFQKLKESRDNYNIAVSQISERRWSNVYADIMTNRLYIKEIRFFNILPYLLEKWERLNMKLNKQNYMVSLKYMLLEIFNAIISSSMILVALGLTIYLILAGQTGVGSLVLVYGSSSVMLDTTGNLFYSFGQLRKISLYADKCREFDNYLTPNKRKNTDDSLIDSIDKCMNIKFCNVSFKYNVTDDNALENIDLEICAGEKVAIVGANGSGKTTFISLLGALYSPQHGDIYVNNLDINSVQPYLKKISAALFQDTTQFELSIRENIEIGDISRKIETSELHEIASKAEFHKDIHNLHNGYETNLGTLESGSINLSGGQWQRLALARTFARKNARIIILDEPTSSLDPISEVEIYENALKLFAKKTLIIVSHRLSVTTMVDKIIVFDNGKVVEIGNHKQLMGAKGQYFNMYKMQTDLYK